MSLYFARFRRELSSLTGVALDADQEYLVISRLAPVMRAHGIEEFPDLLRRLENRREPALVGDVIDAMTTHETSFFRDRGPFDMFRERVLPELVAARVNNRRLRIWCAACSTGQEAYSLAMTLEHEARLLRGWTVDILATDISKAAVETAAKGVYSQFEVQRGLATGHLLRYFHRDGENWRVNEHLRARVTFAELNLLSNFAALGEFDVVLCRNVLLYFDADAKREVLSRLGGVIAADGYLFLGSTERAPEASAAFVPAHAEGVFRAQRTHSLLRLA